MVTQLHCSCDTDFKTRHLEVETGPAVLKCEATDELEQVVKSCVETALCALCTAHREPLQTVERQPSYIQMIFFFERLHFLGAYNLLHNSSKAGSSPPNTQDWGLLVCYFQTYTSGRRLFFFFSVST